MYLFAAIIDKLNEKIVPERVAAPSSNDDEEKKWRQYVIFSSIAYYAYIHIWIKAEKQYTYTLSSFREGRRFKLHWTMILMILLSKKQRRKRMLQEILTGFTRIKETML